MASNATETADDGRWWRDPAGLWRLNYRVFGRMKTVFWPSPSKGDTVDSPSGGPSTHADDELQLELRNSTD